MCHLDETGHLFVMPVMFEDALAIVRSTPDSAEANEVTISGHTGPLLVDVPVLKTSGPMQWEDELFRFGGGAVTTGRVAQPFPPELPQNFVEAAAKVRPNEDDEGRKKHLHKRRRVSSSRP